MECKPAEMDRHEWFIHAEGGSLDTLTGQVGVPELSNHKLGIDWPRDELDQVCNHSPDLEELYAVLTDQQFFLRYLKLLLTDCWPDNLFDTLHEMIRRQLPNLVQNKYTLSMMHFFVHMCKFTAFEYDLLMYFLDILASIFIATNYQRKIFVLQGESSNGKTKLFEILGRIFGSYCVQLNPDDTSIDFVSNNCRVVTIDGFNGELNENQLKQITCKMFASTNTNPEVTITSHYQCECIPMNSTFVKDPPATTQEQILQNRYERGEDVVEQSCEGGFCILYYHLKKQKDNVDGLLYYRKKPDSVTEI